MFEGIRDDFDPRYWTRALGAVLLADAIAVFLGTTWMLTELLSRIAWLLIELLFQWIFPPQLALALQPIPPVTLNLTAAVLHRDLLAGVDTVSVELGEDFDFDAELDPGPDLSMVEAPPDPSALPEPVFMAESGMFGILGSIDGAELDEAFLLSTLTDGGISDMLGVDSDWGPDGGGLVGGIGLGTIGGIEGGTSVGLGGLGTGGGGSEDIGRFGTLGRGSAGEGASVPQPKQTSEVTILGRPTPRLDPSQVDWLVANGSTACRVEVVVTSAGRPKQVTVLPGCPEILHSAATRAMKSSTFKPAMQDGNPVRSTYTTTIHFDKPI